MMMRTKNVDDGVRGSLPRSGHKELRVPDRIVKVYDVIRTAHLERIRHKSDTVVLYKSHRYDFDDELASEVDLRRVGVLGALWFGATTHVDVVEINEPLVARAAPRALAIIGANRFRAAVRRIPRARVVTYAIASMDPQEVSKALPLRQHWKWRLQALMVPLVWRCVDRLAFGTSLSCDLYQALFPDKSRWPTHRIIPALPVSRIALDDVLPRNQKLIFVGDFSPRKGFDKVLDAWPRIREALPGASLAIIGKGVGAKSAISLADRDERVQVLIDPPRARIFEEMSTAKVLILPSQPTKRWREQVGLPIVEGLSMGCEIVTTSETGLAEWLANQGHHVVSDATDVDEIATATIEALSEERLPATVVQALPAQDGREAAEEWLLSSLEDGVLP